MVVDVKVRAVRGFTNDRNTHQDGRRSFQESARVLAQYSPNMQPRRLGKIVTFRIGGPGERIGTMEAGMVTGHCQGEEEEGGEEASTHPLYDKHLPQDQTTYLNVNQLRRHISSAMSASSPDLGSTDIVN
jgi:hypothetical protein